MAVDIAGFEAIVRRAQSFGDVRSSKTSDKHPFVVRNIHPDLPVDTKRLFDNGHFSQATFEAFKFVDEEVQRISGDPDFGRSLMMRVFGGEPPALALNPGMTATEKSEQDGFKFIFAGSMSAIRNPRGHLSGVTDDPDTCLDHLCLASLLLRRLEAAGLR